MKSESTCDVLIVGAGLAGLSTAKHLKGLAHIRMIEASESVGGLSKTAEYQGFRFDHTGHLLHLRDESIKKWVIGELFNNDVPIIDRISRVWSYGVYTKYPYQANTYGLPERVARECIDEYLKVADRKNPALPVRNAEDFIYARFGKGFAKHFMIPYNKKIWGVHPRELSASWGDRFVPMPNKAEVLAGAAPGADQKIGYNSSFYYPRQGMGELSRRIYAEIKDHVPIECGVTLTSIDVSKKIATLSTGERIHYAYLVNTMPLDLLMKSAKTLPTGIRNKAKLLTCKSLQYLDIGLNIPALQKYHWCYIPSPRVPFYRVGIYSNFSDLNAPKGMSSLYVELSSRRYRRTILPKILDTLRDMGLINSDKDVRFVLPRLIKHAYVIYDKNHAKVVPAIHDFLHTKGVYSIGRWGAWNYSSMEDALIMGRTTAGDIAGQL